MQGRGDRGRKERGPHITGDDDELLGRASAVLKSQGRRKLVPLETRYLSSLGLCAGQHRKIPSAAVHSIERLADLFRRALGGA